MRHYYLHIALSLSFLPLLFNGCREADISVATPAEQEQPDEPSLTQFQAEALHDYLKFSAKVEGATATGVNINRFSGLVSDLAGEFLVLKEAWPTEFALEEKEMLVNQLQAYNFALQLWQIKNKELLERPLLDKPRFFVTDEGDLVGGFARRQLCNQLEASRFWSSLQVVKIDASNKSSFKGEFFLEPNIRILLTEGSNLGKQARVKLMPLLSKGQQTTAPNRRPGS